MLEEEHECISVESIAGEGNSGANSHQVPVEESEVNSHSDYTPTPEVPPLSVTHHPINQVSKTLPFITMQDEFSRCSPVYIAFILDNTNKCK